MTDFTELAPAINAYARIKTCGTQTYWPTTEPRPYLVNYAGQPIQQDLIRELWPDLEAAK